MTELSTELTPAAEDPQDSTVIEQENTPAEPNQHQSLSRDDAIDKALDDAEKGDDADGSKNAEKETADGEEVDDKKAEKEAKAEDAKDDKKAEKDAKADKEPNPEAEGEDEGDEDVKAKDAEQAKDEKTKGDDARFIKAPEKFMPDAKEVWHNTPHKVRRDIENMVREHQTEIEQHKQATERYELVRDFDELAQRNGRDLRESLTRVHQIETMMKANPLAGLNAILLEAGPRKNDGQPYSLFEIAQFVAQQGPEKYQQLVAQRPQQQQAPQNDNSEVSQLRQQVAQMQQQQLASSVIDPFKAAHPRFEELKADIAFFLQSDKVPKSLSHADRLAVAYDMAERINPASSAEAPPASAGSASENARVATSSGGSPSTRGAPPSNGATTGSKARRLSKDDAIEKAMSAVFG